MKVFQIQDAWSIDNLTLTDRPRPIPGRGQVLLKMAAASLNYRDLVMARGGYGKLSGSLPLIPLSDGVGEVVETGPETRRLAVGDRVCPMFMTRWIGGGFTQARLASTLGGPNDGVMAEYMVLDETGAASVPAHLSHTEAATLPCAALTAWNAVVNEGGVQPGGTILVQGTGGVSIFALQFAKMIGARVIVTSRSDAKLQRAMDLGADEGLNTTENPAWGKIVKQMAGGDGVDLFVEVGGEQTLPHSLRAIRAGGTISMIGVLSGPAMNVSLGLIVTRHIRLQGITVGSRDDFESMAGAIDKHRLHPVIDRVFSFEALKAAMDCMAEGTHFGKICIEF